MDPPDHHGPGGSRRWWIGCDDELGLGRGGSGETTADDEDVFGALALEKRLYERLTSRRLVDRCDAKLTIAWGKKES